MKGLRVLNTRPLHQAAELDQLIRNAGGISVSFPALTIKALALDWLNDMPDLATVNQAIFISANAVNYYFAALKQANMTWSVKIKVIAVGNATAAALSKQGVRIHHMPEIADSEHLLRLDALQKIQHQTIVLIKGRGGRPLIAETLLSRGACLIPLAVYTRDLPEVNQEYTHSLWQDDAVDIILFTSQQAMNNLFGLFSAEGQAWLRRKPCIVISKRLAAAASLLGIRTVITCRYDEILEALSRYMKKIFSPIRSG